MPNACLHVLFSNNWRHPIETDTGSQYKTEHYIAVIMGKRILWHANNIRIHHECEGSIICPEDHRFALRGLPSNDKW